MNKKLLWGLGLGSISAIGVAGVTVGAIALSRNNDSNKRIDALSSRVTTNVDSINKILDQISTSYNTQARSVALHTDQINNMNSVYEVLAQNVANLLQTVQDQGNAFINLYKQDIATELTNVYKAIGDSNLDTNTKLEQVYTAISNLMERTSSLEVEQANLLQKINEVESNSDTKIADMWTAFSEFKTYIESQQAITTSNFEDINSRVGILQTKVLEINGLAQELLSVQSSIDSILTRLNALEAKVSGIKDYDDTELKARIADLEVARTAIDAKIKTIEDAEEIILTKFGEIDSKINAMDLNLQITGQISTQNALDITTLKTLVNDIMAVQSTANTDIAGLKADLASFNTKLDEVFAKNAQLESDVNNLYARQETLFNNMIDIQTLIRQLQDQYQTSSTVVSIKTDKKLYDARVQKVTYDSVDIANLDKAKTISLFIKIQNKDSSTSYITKIIDTYPENSTTFLGQATSVGKEQFLMGATVSNNKINITKLWSKNESGSSWSDISSDKVSIITLVNAVVTY